MRGLQKVVIGGIVSALVLAALPACMADDSTIYKIEEDWEMVIKEPDSITISPQVTFFTYPSVNLDQLYFQLQMNYAADEGFSGGGFHVAAIQDEEILDEERSDTRLTLATDGDLIRWTSVMAVIQNKVLFAVRDGHGQEWGSFGGPDYLVKITPSPVADLSEYHPEKSLDSVDIGFGANRVDSVTLRKCEFSIPMGEWLQCRPTFSRNFKFIVSLAFSSLIWSGGHALCLELIMVCYRLNHPAPLNSLLPIHAGQKEGNAACAAAVLGLILTVSLVALVAVTLDFGYIHVAETELQRSADASAMAACWELYDQQAANNSGGTIGDTVI